MDVYIHNVTKIRVETPRLITPSEDDIKPFWVRDIVITDRDGRTVCLKMYADKATGVAMPHDLAAACLMADGGSGSDGAASVPWPKRSPPPQEPMPTDDIIGDTVTMEDCPPHELARLARNHMDNISGR